MKKILYTLILLFTAFSCEDVIDLEVPNGKPRLVVDASFEFYTDEEPMTIDGYLRLTSSAPFFNETILPINNATVFITNLNNNSIVNFEGNGNDGFYRPINSNIITPEFNTDYELTIIYNGETYTSITQINPSVPIENIVQGEDTLFGGEETEIKITITDDVNTDNFYLYDFDFGLIEVSEDRFYQGENFTFSYFYDNIEAGQNLTVKILGISQRYFNYANLLIEQSEQGGGNPFQTVPALLRGNIINNSNNDNYALGYFNLSQAYKMNFTLEN